MSKSEDIIAARARGELSSLEAVDAIIEAGEQVATAKMGLLRLHCPGCGCSHQVPVDTGSPKDWTWNGSLTSPTLSPSLHVHPHMTLSSNGEMVETPRCHSFVREGQWQFLGDCTHELAGQTVPVPPIP